jgi:hypothetical protein
MPVTCEIIPTEHLQSEQYRQLAEALAGWCQAESGRRRDVLVEIEGRALADLRGGQLPRPLAERMAEASRVELDPVRQHLGDRADTRGIEVRVHCDQPEEVATSLKGAIPTEFIEEFLLDGKRWESN